MKRQSMDDLHGDVQVAAITVTLARSGNMSIAGTITDENYVLGMLETAAQYLRSQQARRGLEEGSRLIVPSYDTALHRTPLEQKLIAARDDVADAM